MRIAKEHGDGYRHMSMKSNARLGFSLLNIDPKTLEYFEACEQLNMTGGGLQRGLRPGRVVVHDKY
jgi:hypothetical protein